MNINNKKKGLNNLKDQRGNYKNRNKYNYKNNRKEQNNKEKNRN